MIRSSVSSTNILSVGYDEQSQTLEVEFKDGAVYQYYNVPSAVFEALMASGSKGQFFASQIRNVFPFGRV